MRSGGFCFSMVRICTGLVWVQHRPRAVWTLGEIEGVVLPPDAPAEC